MVKQDMCGGAIVISAVCLCTMLFAACSSENNTINEESLRKVNLLNKDIKEILCCTVRAASGHNTQPWKFKVEGYNIKIYPDYSRHLAAVDSSNREMFISLGCAVENLTVAANEKGYKADIAFISDNEGREYINVDLSPAKYQHNPLFDAIAKRQCTRNKYNGCKVSDAELMNIKNACIQDGAGIMLFTDSSEIERMLPLIKEGNTVQFKDKMFLAELKNWIRFSKSDAEKSRDGLKSASFGSPTVPAWLGRFFFDLFLTAGSQNDTDEENLRSSAGLLMVTTKSDDKTDWINAGRVYERFALLAASMNIKNAFLNQPVEVPELRSKLMYEFGTAGKHPQLLLRFGYSNEMPQSLRRNLEDVLM
jgi:hypothetical protein